jgi:hypothetical protein
MTEYYKKTIGTKQYYYAKGEDNIFHVFSPSPTATGLWIYNVNELTTEAITSLLTGATGATRTELDTPINALETVFNNL